MSPLPASLLRLVDNPGRLPAHERFRRLLDVVRELAPCDATALLRLEGDQLVAVAVHGLKADTMGRRFRLEGEPRLATVLARREPLRFAADCGLPDPYDGLIEAQRGDLEVHDCVGCPLFVGERPWGLLTLDALDAARFAQIDLDDLAVVARLAVRAVRVGEQMEGYACQVVEGRGADAGYGDVSQPYWPQRTGRSAAQEVTPRGNLRAAVDELQRRMVRAALHRHGDNWAAAARELGVDRANLHRLAGRLGVKRRR